MNQSLAKYHSRAPRYILQPQDNTLIRVAGPQQVPWEEGTEIQNISLTGLSFTAPHELCPLVGEFIKIQFEVPGQKGMACYGLVTRLEAISGSQMLVGVQFYKLEYAHRLVLLKGLVEKLKEQQRKKEQKYRRQIPYLLLKKWPLSLAMSISLLAWLLLVYFYYFKIS